MRPRRIKLLNYLAKPFLVLLILVVLSGCWDSRELSTLAIVGASGIDLAEPSGKVLLTVQIIKPGEVKSSSSGGEGGSGTEQAASKPPVWVIKTTGNNVAEAVRNFAGISNRQLYFADSQLIIIGKEAAEHGVRPLLDFFIRNREPRETTWIVIAAGKASDLLEVKSGLEKIPAMTLGTLVENSTLTSVTVGVTQQEFVNRLMSKTAAPYASHMEVSEESAEKKVRLTGVDVFKDDKLAGTFNQSETRGFLWVIGKVKRGLITVKSPQGGETNFEINRASSKIIPDLKSHPIRFKVEIIAESDLDSEDHSLDFSNPRTIKVLEKLETKAIRQEIMVAVEKAKKLNVDVFGFGEALHRKSAKKWKLLEPHWDTIFPTVQVSLAIRAKIRTVGLSLKAAEPPKGP
jgi:spore germination protein KC